MTDLDDIEIADSNPDSDLDDDSQNEDPPTQIPPAQTHSKNLTPGGRSTHQCFLNVLNG